jgi:UDP-glucose 4-epimerase
MILLTGATGFVGAHVLTQLIKSNYPLIRTYGRHPPRYLSKEITGDITHVIGEVRGQVDYTAALCGIDVVIHCAAQAHVMKQSENICCDIYKDINVDGALNLASQAIAAGVKRFVFISSVKVNGESTDTVQPFNHISCTAPEDDYGRSKKTAEDGLRKLVLGTGMDLVVIRPPLVYGPGVKGNFLSMMNLINKNIPIPLGSITNKRSLVALDNLVDLIITCIDHPKASNQTFLVSDDQDVSTTELLKKMASAFGKKSRLIPVPMCLIQLIASLLGKRAVAQRLCSSLVVDISHTKETLSWKPPVTMEQQLAKIAASLS